MFTVWNHTLYCSRYLMHHLMSLTPGGQDLHDGVLDTLQTSQVLTYWSISGREPTLPLCVNTPILEISQLLRKTMVGLATPCSSRVFSSSPVCIALGCVAYCCSVQEALTRVSSGTVHYSSARTLNSTEQPLFAATARALCQSAAPYTVSCYKRVYPETSARLDTEQAVKGLKELIQSWDQERSQMSGELAPVRPYMWCWCLHSY